MYLVKCNLVSLPLYSHFLVFVKLEGLAKVSHCGAIYPRAEKVTILHSFAKSIQSGSQMESWLANQNTVPGHEPINVPGCQPSGECLIMCNE